MLRCNDMSAVAVIMSVYKNDKLNWFKEAIESLKSQDIGWENINLYLGIDGELPMEVEEYISELSPYKVIKNEKNMGLAATLNKLISELDSEEFIFRMDSDDVCMPERIATQLSFMMDNPDIDISGSAIYEVDESLTPVRLRHFYQEHANISKNMHKGTAVGHVTVCFRRSALNLLGGYSTSYPLNEDIELWFRAIGKGVRFGNLDQPLVNVRVSSSFYERRSFVKAKYEFLVYWKGCVDLYGVTYRHLFVIARFAIRMMPAWIVEKLYKGSLRDKLFR